MHNEILLYIGGLFLVIYFNFDINEILNHIRILNLGKRIHNTSDKHYRSHFLVYNLRK